MPQITAAMVGELRAKTDAPMMECKKALTEAQGDMEKAEELLRIKLGGKASKAASRVTAEGVVATFTSGNRGAMVEVNCETDFVTKNDEFINLVNACARLVAEHDPADLAALGALPLNGSTVEGVRAELIGRIGENMLLRRFTRFESAGRVVSYQHGSRIGVLVELEGATEQAGKDIAMHIAAMKPVALSSAEVSSDLIEKERAIALAKAGEAGKPAEIAAKMADGAVQKYMKDVSLLDQPFVKNDKQTVGQMVKEAGGSVKRFAMFIVGEGIEKKQDDFAAEVAAQVAAAQKSA